MAYYDCIAHGEDVGVTCSECFAEMEADRDRLREERDLLSENYVQCVTNVKEIVEALAADSSRLREEVTRLQRTYDEIAGRPDWNVGSRTVGHSKAASYARCAKDLEAVLSAHARLTRRLP